MSKVVFTVGIPCSGKTSWAEQRCKEDSNWVNVNRDDIRFSITGTAGWGEYKFTKSSEKMVTATQEAMCIAALSEGKNVIISDTNLNWKTRSNWRQFIMDHSINHVDISFKEFPISFEEACRRDALRPNGVGVEVIYRMHQKWLKYINRYVYTPNENMPCAIIVDVDGTIADMGGIRGPFDWSKVGSDKPRREIITAVQGFDIGGYEIIICSGRDGQCESDTRQWLDKHHVPYDAFFIRKEGDNRKDTIIKEEIFINHIADNWNIKAVIDDRPSVCRMWRELGLQVIQVANPNIEF